MNISQRRLSMAVAAGAAGFAGPVAADFDQWRISEIFTNADATIQYVELVTMDMNQGDVAGLVLTAMNADGQQQNIAILMNDLSGDTSNRILLIATESFAELTDLNPDLLVPDGFLFTEGGPSILPMAPPPSNMRPVNFPRMGCRRSMVMAQLSVPGRRISPAIRGRCQSRPTPASTLLPRLWFYRWWMYLVPDWPG